MARGRLIAFANTDPPARERYFEGTKWNSICRTFNFLNPLITRTKARFPSHSRTLQFSPDISIFRFPGGSKSRFPRYLPMNRSGTVYQTLCLMFSQTVSLSHIGFPLFTSGGDAKLLVMLCVSPAQRFLTETLQCLGFGSRARQVARGKTQKRRPTSFVPNNLTIGTFFSGYTVFFCTCLGSEKYPGFKRIERR